MRWCQPVCSRTCSFSLVILQVAFQATCILLFQAAFSAYGFLLSSACSRLGHQLNTIGLFLSLAYLGWAIFAGEYVKRGVTEKLGRQQIGYSQFIASPAPFNTLLWRIVGIDKDRYFETYFSVFDGNTPLSVDFYPRNLALMAGVEEHSPVVKLKRFTKGYYAFSTEGNYVAMTDLRMGSEPDYVFRFKVAGLNDLHPDPIDDERLESNLDWRHLAWVWKRIWNTAPNLENIRSQNA
jgi:inner membrane protein